MISEKLEKAATDIGVAIKETQEYRDFLQQKKNAMSSADTRQKIEHARSLQQRLMDIPEHERNNDYAESLQDEYEELTENTAVYDYIRAESAYMTMIQEVLGTIVENVDIDI